MQSPPEQQPTHDFGKHTSIGVVIMFCNGTTAQLYSRLETGRLFYGWMFAIGVFLEGTYCAIKSGFFHADATPYITVLGVHLVAFSLHSLYRIWRLQRGIELASYDPGFGILAYLYPSLPLWLSSFLSDICVAGLLAAAFDLTGSPVHRDWYLWIVMPSLVISQLWIRARDQFLRQKHIDANAEARHYAHTIHRR